MEKIRNLSKELKNPLIKVLEEIRGYMPLLENFLNNPESVFEELIKNGVIILKNSGHFVGSLDENKKISTKVVYGRPIVIGLSEPLRLGLNFHEIVHVFQILGIFKIGSKEELEKLEKPTVEAWLSEISASILGFLCDLKIIKNGNYSLRNFWSLYVNLLSVILYGTFIGLTVREVEGLMKRISFYFGKEKK
jgi:hypothetical protein